MISYIVNLFLDLYTKFVIWGWGPRLRYLCYTLAEETLFRWGGGGGGRGDHVKSMIVQWSI